MIRPALDVLAEEHVERSLGGRTASLEVQSRIFLNAGERNELHGVPV